jgi:starvation-inducible DNA-binding protein
MNSQLTSIGLETSKSNELADHLNDLLANYSVFYMNVRGYHWNIKGDKFFELHAKFEELYNDLQLKIDELAERILTLGKRPYHSYSVYVERSEIQEVKDVSDGHACVRGILDAFQILILKQRQLLDLSDKADDEGTNALMSDYIREQEKLVWMYNSFMGS